MGTISLFGFFLTREALAFALLFTNNSLLLGGFLSFSLFFRQVDEPALLDVNREECSRGRKLTVHCTAQPVD